MKVRYPGPAVPPEVAVRPQYHPADGRGYPAVPLGETVEIELPEVVALARLESGFVAPCPSVEVEVATADPVVETVVETADIAPRYGRRRQER